MGHYWTKFSVDIDGNVVDGYRVTVFRSTNVRPGPPEIVHEERCATLSLARTTADSLLNQQRRLYDARQQTSIHETIKEEYDGE